MFVPIRNLLNIHPCWPANKLSYSAPWSHWHLWNANLRAASGCRYHQTRGWSCLGCWPVSYNAVAWCFCGHHSNWMSHNKAPLPCRSSKPSVENIDPAKTSNFICAIFCIWPTYFHYLPFKNYVNIYIYTVTYTYMYVYVCITVNSWNSLQGKEAALQWLTQSFRILHDLGT